MDRLWLLIPIFVLLFLSGQFSGIETAYSSCNKIRLRTMEADGNEKAGKVLKVLDRFENLLTMVLIGNNLLNILITTLSTIMFVHLFQQNEAVGSIVSTAVTTLIVLLFAEITPKVIARNMPESAALLYYPFVRILQFIFYPFVMAFRGWQYLLSKAFHFKQNSTITEEELMTYVEAAEDEGQINAHESTLIRNAIEFDNLETRDIMVPRVSVMAAADTAKPDEIAEIFRESGFSRLPIYHNSIDSIIGFVHEKDFNALYYNQEPDSFSLLRIVKPATCVSEAMKVSLVLRILQRKKQHIAVVVDEFGGTAGIVTMEDILEELVGEIWDEHDEVEELLSKRGDEYIAVGFANIDDVFEVLKIDEPDCDATTVGGWVIEQMGRIPTPGEKFTYKNIETTILKSNSRRVLEVKFTVR